MADVVGMRSAEDLAFILARVRATWGGPAVEPSLDKVYGAPKRATRPCRRGHTDAGRTSSGHCRECDRIRKRKGEKT